MMTSEQSTGKQSSLWMFSQEDSLANHTLSPGSDRPARMNETSGQNANGRCENYTQKSVYGKTCLDSSLQKMALSSRESLTTSIISDTGRECTIYRLNLLEQDISGEEYSSSARECEMENENPESDSKNKQASSQMMFWRTPTAEGDGGERGLGKMTSQEAKLRNIQITLSRQVRDAQMWPTPSVGCTEGREQSNRVELTEKGGFTLRKKNKPNNTFGAKLSDAVLMIEKQKLYPTPTQDAVNQRVKKYSQGGTPLTMAVMYPTPSVMDVRMDIRTPQELLQRAKKGGCSNLREHTMRQYLTPLSRDYEGSGFKAQLPNSVQEIEKKSGTLKLNPEFVEWLMNFPPGWTMPSGERESEPSGMQSFLLAQNWWGG